MPQADNTVQVAYLTNIDNTLQYLVQNLKISNEENQVFTCGSGVTACILAMANKIISDKNPVVYDGSWSEYGLK